MTRRDPSDPDPAIVVGFASEAKIARSLGWQIAIGGGSTEGAAREARRLITSGATGLVSFGLAGGLRSTLRPGTLVVADAITVGDQTWQTDIALSNRLGGMTGHVGLGIDRIVALSSEKCRLGQATGADLVDMESGAIAAAASEAGIPFAVLRVVCDPVNRSLPPAALVALDPAGRIAFGRLAWSVLTNPGQTGALAGLARDSAVARKALRARVATIRMESRVSDP